MWGVTRGGLYVWDGGKVSIHTPVWGVTDVEPQHSTLGEVSIHTPVWGVTDTLVHYMLGVLFQSTRPCGA